jgi:hypothetical protein
MSSGGLLSLVNWMKWDVSTERGTLARNAGERLTYEGFLRNSSGVIRVFHSRNTCFQLADLFSLRRSLGTTLRGWNAGLDFCCLRHHGRCWVRNLVLEASPDHREREKLRSDEVGE